jgi:hypothetical protein
MGGASYEDYGILPISPAFLGRYHGCMRRAARIFDRAVDHQEWDYN